MAKGNSLLLLGLVGVGIAAFALSGTTSAAPAATVGCVLDPSIPPAIAQSVNTLLAATPGSIPASTYTNLATQVRAAGYPMAATCLTNKAAQLQPNSGGINPATQSLLNNIRLGPGASILVQQSAAQSAFYNALVSLGWAPDDASKIISNSPLGPQLFQALTAGGMPSTQAAQLVLTQLSLLGV